MNQEYPDSFWIPSQTEKDEVVPGNLVKLYFETSDGWAERMWVEVRRASGSQMSGRLRNDPIGIPRLGYNQRVRFEPHHIIDIMPATEDGVANDPDAA